MTEVEEFLKESNLIESEGSPEAFVAAVDAWNYLNCFDSISIDRILETHRILLKELRPEIAGKFRTVNVRVGNHTAPPWHGVNNAMFNWLINHSRAKTEDAIIKAHIAFEKLHPFEDGNGRVGRIILNWQRVKNGFPISIIHVGEEQMAYYQIFK